ncbi:Heat shock protein 20 [Aphelenchoides besseyi]|nr:Heat shock protein 20 [Aphelenchoides besseyi]KAI6199621.1 Heat shock protein 20 [Aphelenchoides besseyi]
MLRRCGKYFHPVGRVALARGFFGPPAPLGGPGPRHLVDELERRFDRLQRELFGHHGHGPWAPAWRPFAEHPTDTETFRLRNPIIEENGVKKFKVSFDVRRFKPEEVKVSTDKDTCTLLIEASHKDEHSSFEFSRKLKVPEGVKLTDITANYSADGVIEFEAPYIEPPQPDPPKPQAIEIKHN